MSLLTVRNLSIRFAGRTRAEDVHAVRGLSFSLDAGECLAIVGESGSGKSASARALVGLTGSNALTQADEMRLGNLDLTGLDNAGWRGVRGRHIGFVLQDALVSLDPLKTIGQEVAETLRQHRLATPQQIPARVAGLLRSVGIPDPELRARQYPHQLSGGLRQRALIASALSGAPQVLIADEPTTALDVIVQAQILDLLGQMKASGKAVILISHDLAVVARLADRIIVLKDGEMVEQGPAADVLQHPRAAYTRQLLAAIPSARTRGKALVAAGPGGGADGVQDLGKDPGLPQQSGQPRTPERQPASGMSAPKAAASGAGTVPGPGGAGAQTVLSAMGLSKSYGARPVVQDVSLTIARGETLGLVGASGSGKTTLARILLALETADRGEVLLQGQPWSALPERRRRAIRPKVQLVSQDPMGAFDPRWSVARILDEALVLAGHSAAARGPEALALLRSVGLDAGHLPRRPRQLSGGQRQRVAIARALAMKPELLICDEPVSALDVSTQAQVLDLLARLKRELGLTMLFVSHDLGVIHHVSDRVLVMNQGRIVEEGPVDQVLETPRDPYTRALLDALPRLPRPDVPQPDADRLDAAGSGTFGTEAPRAVQPGPSGHSP